LRGLRPCYGWNKNRRNADASGGDFKFHWLALLFKALR